MDSLRQIKKANLIGHCGPDLSLNGGRSAAYGEDYVSGGRTDAVYGQLLSDEGVSQQRQTFL